jgi:hypothetical protein
MRTFAFERPLANDRQRHELSPPTVEIKQAIGGHRRVRISQLALQKGPPSSRLEVESTDGPVSPIVWEA